VMAHQEEVGCAKSGSEQHPALMPSTDQFHLLASGAQAGSPVELTILGDGPELEPLRDACGKAWPRCEGLSAPA